MKQVTFFIIFSFSFISYSQEGEIKVIKDKRIGALVEKEAEVVPPATKPEISGYRIQLFFDSDKTAINDARLRFVAKFQEIDTYVEFNAPNFILKVGDFRTHLEAERVKAALEGDFPTSFVIKEKINLPRLEQDSNL